MPNQSQQGGMFSRYSGEQVNQIPQGYIEGKSAWGRAAQNVADNYLKMRMDRENRAQQANANLIAQQNLALSTRAQQTRDDSAAATERYKAAEARANAERTKTQSYVDVHKMHSENFNAAKAGYDEAAYILSGKDKTATKDQITQAGNDILTYKQSMADARKGMQEATSNMTSLGNTASPALAAPTTKRDLGSSQIIPLPDSIIRENTSTGTVPTASPAIQIPSNDSSYFSEEGF